MIEMLNMDCMEFMKDVPDKAFDLAIVDPPYGIGNCINTNGKKHYKKMHWNQTIPPKKYFNELYRISKNQIIWGANYYRKFVRHPGIIIHDKLNGGQFQGPKSLSDADIASQSYNNLVKMFRYGWSGNRMNNTINFNNDGPDSRFHPTQKPIALYKWLLKNYAKPGDKILDTHGGSGSICISCYDMGFDLTWMEIDKDYYDAACQRFKRHTSQARLFEPEGIKPEQMTI
jgi:site-specific DNA-methyltransferase (adenine-specific)